MNIEFDKSIVAKYHSNSQIARVLTENWVEQNMYCPRCGNLSIEHFENNRPVADFFCPVCKNEYELKSKSGALGRKIADGAYDTMLKRITSNENPDFFFMSYSKNEFKISNFMIIPKHFFVPNIIEKRNPLSPTARRAGWVGCNILIDKIPEQGRISIISNGCILDAKSVKQKVNISTKLEMNNIDNRGWLLDVLNCTNALSKKFTLEQMYTFENVLQEKHPKNNNVRPKIRQQLQLLRDKGFIEFLGNGRYAKIL